ncbi:MAG: DNA-directed RNA polymerase subunit omega [Nitriliruptoraceae bacterium]
MDDLMNQVDSRFHLVHLAARRAREVNNYFAHLGEGLGQFVPPLVSTETNKPLSIALEEISLGKIIAAEPREIVTEDPLAFIDESEEGDTEA